MFKKFRGGRKSGPRLSPGQGGGPRNDGTTPLQHKLDRLKKEILDWVEEREMGRGDE